MIRIPSMRVMRLRGGRDELRQQPQTIAETLRSEADNIAHIASEVAKRPIDRIILTGCGDSYISGVAVQYAFERWLKRPVETIQALEYTRYYHHLTNERTLVLAQSSSGTTERTYEAFMTAKQAGAFVIGVTNTAHTPLLKETDAGILVRATRFGWPTQASTAAVAATLLLALDLAQAWKTLDAGELKSLREELHGLPNLVKWALDQYDDMVKELVQQWLEARDFFFVGGGPSLATAQFGAAKVKEYSLDHAVALQLEEYHHYRSLKEGEPLFLVAPQGQGHDRALETAQSARRAKGKLYALVEQGDDSIASLADAAFVFPPMTEALTTIPYVIPLHLVADHLSVAKGHLD